MAEGWLRKRFKPNEITSHITETLDGLWEKCPSCSEIQYRAELERNFKVCKKCGYHFRLRAWERVEMLADENATFEPWDENLATVNPLSFPQYLERLESHRRKTGLTEAILCGRTVIGGQEVALGITDPHFKMGTMNSVVGERIALAAERAIDRNLPLILICGSGGGARMEEGILSLMQMAKTAAALGMFRSKTSRMFISVLTDPTMGGTMASWASLGDIIYAEPGAMIGLSLIHI